MEESMPPIISMEKTFQKPFPSKAYKVIYALLFLSAAVGLGCIPLYAGKLNISPDLAKLLQMVLFCGLGMIHARKITQYNLSPTGNDNNKLVFSAPLSLLIFVALVVLYYMMGAALLLLALGSASLFILPGIISSSWQAFNEYSQIQYKIWAVPIENTREKTFIFFSGIALKIRFSVDATDKNKTVFRSLAPLDKTLGEFFNHFLLIQRNNNRLNIDLLDEWQKPFGWRFYKIDLLGFRKTTLDPEATIKELELKNHETIMIRRVRLDEMENNESY